MNREDIIRMAREASSGNDDRNIFFDLIIDELEAFAALVASAAVRETSAEYRLGWNDGEIAEREACAGLRKEVELKGMCSTEYEEGFWNGLAKYEDLIRARGQA